MDITINLELLKKYQLTPNMYIWLYIKIHKIEKYDLVITNAEKQELESNQLIKVMGNKVILRPRLKEVFLVEQLEDWIMQYRELFKGTRGFKPMGDKSVTLQKMGDFLKENPKYKKADIISAAERYLNHCRTQGIPSRQADFFIYKQEMVDGRMVKKSDLLSTLEDIENAVEIVQKIQSQTSTVKW